jgi:hypothetical protein
MMLLNLPLHYERTADMLASFQESNTREKAVENACLHTPQERAVVCLTASTTRRELLIMPNCAHQQERAVDVLASFQYQGDSC